MHSNSPNTFLFGSKFAHNAQGVLHGDECALCGKRTFAGRGVQFVGYSAQRDEVLHPSNIAQHNADGGDAVLVLVGEDCYYRNRATVKPFSATVRTQQGRALATEHGLDAYLPVLRSKVAPSAEVAEQPAEVADAPSAEVAEQPAEVAEPKTRSKRRAKATA